MTMPETNVAAEITAFFGISSWSDDGADLGKVGKLAAAIVKWKCPTTNIVSWR